MQLCFKYNLIFITWVYISFSFQLVAEEKVRTFSVLGANDLSLNVIASGSNNNPGFLFIHGSGQSSISWNKQFGSSLRNNFHLVAFDLRGHGSSGKPRSSDEYNKACIWAEDIKRIINGVGLERPVLVGWSKGGLMVMHYLSCFGFDAVAGIVLIASQANLVNVSASFGLERAKVTQQQLLSRNINKILLGAKNFTALMTSGVMDPEWNLLSRSMNVMVPPYVRTAIQGAVFKANGEEISNYSSLFANFSVPVMIVLGAKDPFRKPNEMASAYRKTIPWSTIKIYKRSGHSPFMEEPDLFNKDIKDFAISLYTKDNTKN